MVLFETEGRVNTFLMKRSYGLLSPGSSGPDAELPEEPPLEVVDWQLLEATWAADVELDALEDRSKARHAPRESSMQKNSHNMTDMGMRA
eukprot:1518443-Amphidinium_carterae.1